MIDAWNSLSPALKLRSIVIVLAILAPWWLAPLRIKEKQKRPGMPERMELVPGLAAVPQLLAAFVAATQRTLAELGFTKLSILRQRQGVIVLGEDARGTVAVGLALPKPDGTVHSLVGFTTQLGGGVKLRTSNSPLPAPTPAPSGEQRLRLPRERDTAKLYAIHQGRVADALAHGARIVPLTVADPVAYQQREEQSSISNALSCGYWSRRGEQLVLTWKGAFLSAWRLLPPWKQLVARRDERLAARFARA